MKSSRSTHNIPLPILSPYLYPWSLQIKYDKFMVNHWTKYLCRDIHHFLPVAKYPADIVTVFCTHRSAGQRPFCWLIPELQHPAAGRGGWAGVCGRQRSSLRAQQLQHLHTWKAHGECRDAAPHIIPSVDKETKEFPKFSPVSEVLRESKLIIALNWFNVFLHFYGLSVPGIYSRVTEDSQ